MTPLNNSQLVRQKVERRLQEIAEAMSGAFGLCAVDLTSNETFSIHENAVFPQASAIKIPILMEIYRQAEVGKFKLTDGHQVKAAEKTTGSGILAELGDESVRLSLYDLCVLMIVLSDNTATNILIDLAGMANINRMLESLGLKQTRLQRRMMDLTAASRGEENISTPAEAVKIMKLLQSGEFINPGISKEILQILMKRKPTPLSAGLPGGLAIASKPGGIAGVVTEWAIVQLPQRPYTIAVMENYGVEPEASAAIKEVSQLLHQYFSRLSRSTAYGTYLEAKN